MGLSDFLIFLGMLASEIQWTICMNFCSAFSTPIDRSSFLHLHHASCIKYGCLAAISGWKFPQLNCLLISCDHFPNGALLIKSFTIPSSEANIKSKTFPYWPCLFCIHLLIQKVIRSINDCNTKFPDWDSPFLSCHLMSGVLRRLPTQS